jgi:hypothetical protein
VSGADERYDHGEDAVRSRAGVADPQVHRTVQRRVPPQGLVCDAVVQTLAQPTGHPGLSQGVQPSGQTPLLFPRVAGRTGVMGQVPEGDLGVEQVRQGTAVPVDRAVE